MSLPAAAIRTIARSLLILVAHDGTEHATRGGMLVVAPHPDDETLGCGARILRARRSGTVVTIVVATGGGRSHDGVKADPQALTALRSGELAEAASRLDVESVDVHELGYPDGELAGHLNELVADLTTLVERLQPAQVYVTCADESHPDHSAAAQAARRALSGRADTQLFEYPIWLWNDWPVSRRFRGRSGLVRWWKLILTRAVEKERVGDLSGAKQNALAAYVSQLGGDGSDPAAAAIRLPEHLVRRAIRGPELFFQIRSC